MQQIRNAKFWFNKIPKIRNHLIVHFNCVRAKKSFYILKVVQLQKIHLKLFVMRLRYSKIILFQKDNRSVSVVFIVYLIFDDILCFQEDVGAAATRK